MFIQPVYNILLLPDVTYYFKKDFFSVEADNVKGDTDVLFLMLKNETENRSPVSDDFYPIGVSARIESVSDEDVVQVRTLNGIAIDNMRIENGEILGEFRERPTVEDMTEDDQQAVFTELRTALLRFVQGYQWGLWARGYIL